MGKIGDLLHNYVLMVALVSWLLAQVLKTLFSCVKYKKLDLERMVGAGGMPSAHTATVVSLVIAISRSPEGGFSSPEFAIAFILAAVVMYDAMGVRRAAGEQAKVINQIVENQNLDEIENSLDGKPLKEFLGHTPLEVLGGALLGILTAMILPVS